MKRIAEALDEGGRPEQASAVGVAYLVARRGSWELFVASALGHLYGLEQEGRGWGYPAYGYRWAPIRAPGRIREIQARIRAFNTLSTGIDQYVSACDLDTEGSLIAYNILRYACGEASLGKAKRMRFSSLTGEELQHSWSNLERTLDFPVIAAGKVRHEVDWLYGINLSRALASCYRKAKGERRVLSIGRVQGPTLKFIVDREVEIRCHVPLPYWVIEAETTLLAKRYPLRYDKPRLDSKAEADAVVNTCTGKIGTITEIREHESVIPPPHPFSLGDLQREAYRHLRLTPSESLKVAESLYLAALISYPRTSSQQYPPTLDIRRILKKLSENKTYESQAASLLTKPKLSPRNGSKTDPAHPAIHPTGKKPGRLSEAEQGVYDLVVKRFMASLGEPARRLETDTVTDVEGYIFHLEGVRTLDPGWILLYQPYAKVADAETPRLNIGSNLPITKIQSLGKFSQPPPRYNPSSLLKLMEDEGIGTKATRSEIIEILRRRGYTWGSVEPTDLGFTVVETLSRHTPVILDVETTRRMEDELEAVVTGGANPEDIASGVRGYLDSVLERFKAYEKEIGTNLASADSPPAEHKAKEPSKLGACPQCLKGEIRVIQNPKTGKRFAACSDRRSCGKTYPLPQRGRLTPINSSCPVCGSPQVKVGFRAKSRQVCINPACSGKGGGKP